MQCVLEDIDLVKQCIQCTYTCLVDTGYLPFSCSNKNSPTIAVKKLLNYSSGDVTCDNFNLISSISEIKTMLTSNKTDISDIKQLYNQSREISDSVFS